MIQSYKKQNKTESRYDAIIIGSGMGGLTTAALLAKEGQKILLLERHYTPGGFTHVFKRKGYEWDVGIHYIGEVQRPMSVIKKLFDYVSDGNLKWADMGQVYDRIIIGNKKYDFVKGVQNFKKQLVSYFPDEEKAIGQYIEIVFAANKTMGKFYMDKALPRILSKVIGWKMRKNYLKYSDQTTHEVLSKLTKNKELIKVLEGQYGDYGLPPKQSSFAMHASVVKHYFGGGSFPVGGSSEIVNTIEPVIAAAGGTLLISAEVEKIIIEKNKVKGVQMSDGKCFNSEVVISSTGIFNTYEKLLPEAVCLKHNLKSQLNKITPSVAHACLYIGLKGTPTELKLPKHNLWIYPDKGDHDTIVADYLENTESAFPVVYVSFPAAKDPSWTTRYPGHSTIDIITLLPYETIRKWEGTQWMKRGEDYNDFKEKIAQRLLKQLFLQLPHLENKVDHYELSTPITTQNFVNYKKGEIYGLDHTPKRFRQRFLQPRTPVKGLYLTGQDIVTAGVGGALMSGLLTASAITGFNFIKKIYQKS